MSEVVKLSVPAMKCGGCVSAIETALKHTTGVINAEFDLESKTVTIESDTPVSTLVATIKTAGYDAVESGS